MANHRCDEPTPPSCPRCALLGADSRCEVCSFLAREPLAVAVMMAVVPPPPPPHPRVARILRGFLGALFGGSVLATAVSLIVGLFGGGVVLQLVTALIAMLVGMLLTALVIDHVTGRRRLWRRRRGTNG